MSRGSGRRPGRMPPLERLHGDRPEGGRGPFEAVYELVRSIPRGRVMTYGQIATLIENRLSPRAVGWALHGCPADVPWQRVVNARGACSTDRLHDMPAGAQRALLESEGVPFDENGRIDLDRYRWEPGPEELRQRPGRSERRGQPPRRPEQKTP